MRSLSHKNLPKFNQFYLGAVYYPEHWSSEEFDNDIKLMRESNLNIVRMGEFAWDMFEKTEGVFDFNFFDQAIDKLNKAGIKTIFCTPTATPPRWLSKKYPQILRKNLNSEFMQHGSRQHACTNNLIFREYSRKITTEIAKHFQKNPAIISFQTDNELNCHFSFCYCDSCQKAFRQFLQNKYTTIDKLNQAWGTAFWAQSYLDFDDIELPKHGFPTYPNPSAMLDMRRFHALGVAEFQAEQIQILRSFNPDWIIFHNGMMQVVDYRGKFGKDLDILGFDSYPFFTIDSTERSWKNAYSLDRTRSLGGAFIIPEHQFGPGGQPDYLHRTPETGEIQMITLRSIARGCESLLYFRWRSCRYGAEEYWCGIIDWDNIPRRRYNEFCEITKNMHKIAPKLRNAVSVVDVAVGAGDADANSAHDIYPLGLSHPEEIAMQIYQEYFQNHYRVGVIHPSDDLSEVKLYFVPHWQILTLESVQNLTEFVKNGGTLVVGARSANRDLNNHIIKDSAPGILRELCGITVDEFGKLPINDPIARQSFELTSGEVIDCEEFYEVLKVEDKLNTAVCGVFNSRFLKNLPAVSCRKFGKGQVFYVGSYLTTKVISKMRTFLDNYANLAPISPNIGREIEIIERKDNNCSYRVILNTTGEMQVLASDLCAAPWEIILGNAELQLPPYGFKVLQKS